MLCGGRELHSSNQPASAGAKVKALAASDKEAMSALRHRGTARGRLPNPTDPC